MLPLSHALSLQFEYLYDVVWFTSVDEHDDYGKTIWRSYKVLLKFSIIQILFNQSLIEVMTANHAWMSMRNLHNETQKHSHIHIQNPRKHNQISHFHLSLRFLKFDKREKKKNRTNTFMHVSYAKYLIRFLHDHVFHVCVCRSWRTLENRLTWVCYSWFIPFFFRYFENNSSICQAKAIYVKVFEKSKNVGRARCNFQWKHLISSSYTQKCNLKNINRMVEYF